MSKPLDSLLSHDPGESQNVSMSKDINGCVKTSEKVVKYRIRFAVYSSHKKCDVEAMMAMKKDKACKWFHNSVKKHACVKPSQHSFAQDGGGQKKMSLNFPFVMIVCTQRWLLAKTVERLTLSLSL